MTSAEENRPTRSTYLSLEQQELLFAEEFPDREVEPPHPTAAACVEPCWVPRRRTRMTSGASGPAGGASPNLTPPAESATGLTAAPVEPSEIAPAIRERLNVFPPPLLAGPAAWVDARSVRSGRIPGGGTVPESWNMSYGEALARLRAHAGRQRERMITALATLAAYKVLTLEQWADMTGLPELRHAGNQLPADLFCAGAVQFARYPGFIAELAAQRRKSRRREPADLVKVGDSDFAGLLLRSFSQVERAWIRGHEPWPQPSPYPLRHDVLANELVLRIAEVHGSTGVVTAVLGEPSSRHHFLNGSAVSASETKPSRCDGAVVRADDLVIAFEVVNAINADGARTKARRVCQLVLGEGPYQRGSRAGNVAVIFVIVTPDERSERVRVTNKLCAALESQLWGATEAWKRIGVIDWRDWFPDSGGVTPAFEGLEAHRFNVTTRRFDLGEAGRMVSFLDVPKAPAQARSSGERAESFGDAARMMEHNPPWLRHPDLGARRKYAVRRYLESEFSGFEWPSSSTIGQPGPPR